MEGKADLSVVREDTIFQGYLIIASAAFLFVLWRRSKRLGNEAWFKQWKEDRKQPKAKLSVSKQPEKIEEYTKIVRTHCGGKIAFPLNRLGENIACPHCAATTALQHPTNNPNVRAAERQKT